MTCSFSEDFTAKSYTDVENLFISEYLPIADGEAVKVYLYGLYLCRAAEADKPISAIADALKMTEQKVKECFSYWEEFGILSVVCEQPYEVRYLPVRSAWNGKARKYKTEKYTGFTKSLQATIPSRMISMSEYTEYFNLMETFGISPDAMLMIVKYCVDRKGEKVSYRYVSAVARNFGEKGITSVEQVESELSDYVARTSYISLILKALSIKRQPEIEDSELFKKWTEDMSFEPDNVVFAAKKMKKGSMEKLDSFIKELYSMKSFSKEEISDYIDKKQSIFELTVKINKALSVYVDVLETEVDEYVGKWISYGFEEETLILIAKKCFLSGKNNLSDMDAAIEFLRKRGFVSISSVSDYFEELKKTDEFIVKLLATAGVNRKPNPWDRENITTWRSWNFTDEMIEEAAKRAAGKNNPLAYMNGILSNWKKDGVYTASALPEENRSVFKEIGEEEYNREYQKRRARAVSVAQKNLEKAYNADGFAETYSRLNSIERDFAIAEMSQNKDKLSALENEKKALIKKAEEILAGVGLSFSSLEPQYACKKCGDTGYIGNKRCDCFDKK